MTGARIRKFHETDEYGHRLARTAYVIDPTSLPSPHPRTEWREDLQFDEAKELRENSTLRIVYEAARTQGVALVG